MKATSRRIRVLSIDPGYDRLGIAVLEGTASAPELLWSACVTPPKCAASERLAHVFRSIANAISAYQPDYVALETLFFSKNKKTALQVAEARGTILAAAGIAGVPILEYSPQQIKTAVTGYGNADKAAVGQMVARLVRLPKKRRLDDELDAIGVGITALASYHMHRL